LSAIRIPSPLLEDIRRHAAQSYPEECCGVLLGTSEDGSHRIVELVQARNEREAESRHNRYLIPPITVLDAHKRARAQGLDVVGYYHSHPDHPAIPSEFDREHAWPATSYVIVSVSGGEVREARSWRLLDNRERFEEESVEETGRAR